MVKKITPEMLGHANNFASSQGFEGMFKGEMGEDPNKHLKELLSTGGDIDGKTDLNPRQINAIIKLTYMAYFIGEVKHVKTKDFEGDRLIPNETIINIVDNFKRLRISLKRKSREEFLRGIQGSNSMNRQEGLVDRMGNWFRGG